jgi:hypothetical protein
MRAPKKLGEILVDLKVLTPTEVERVLQALNRRVDRQKFGQVARDMGLIDEAHIWAALAVQMDLFPGVQFLNLGHVLRLLQTPEPAAASA